VESLILSPAALGRTLRDARLERGLTQSDLAQRSGLTQATVSSIERGQSNVSLDTLLRLVATLRLELVLRSRQAARRGGPSDA
jgi:transcriptional regulator with XRE-family HTH domain